MPTMPHLPEHDKPRFRTATVGIVGRTNAGKSTLINRLIGEKISIVTPVVQTTRNLIRGFFADARGQLLLLDTPGLHQAQSTLGTMMNRMARQTAGNTDIALLLADASQKPQLEDEGWFRKLLVADTPVVIALNKRDDPHFNPAPFAALWQQLAEEERADGKTPLPFAPLHVSAETGAGTDALLDRLFELAQPSDEPLFDEELVTDYPRKLAIADIIREKLLAKLHEEVPHEIAVVVDTIEEHTPDNWTIRATVLVNRYSQKGIVIGPKGRTLRYVKRMALPEINAAFDLTESTLDIWVKEEKNWMKNFFLLRQLGCVGDA